MRFILIIFSIAIIGFACVKPKTKNPVPVIEFVSVNNLGKATGGGMGPRDTAVIVLKYEDGDGNLFVDNTTEGPNVIFTTYVYNSVTGKFDGQLDPITQDTLRITTTIKQPDGGYYKGKSIKGEIFIPMKQYRLNDNIKIIKFAGFVIDTKDNKSNVVSSPVYTLNF